jgi:AraC-like DNA-binding protein/mannose-6-phosphate isomerase-like protein (cupin superfamily)
MEHVSSLSPSARSVVGLRDEYPAGHTDPAHTHDRAQFLYACSGVMSVITPATTFIIPPQRALWLPVGVEHEVSCRGAVSLRTLYIDPAYVTDASVCRVVEVSDFLKALILEIVSFDTMHNLTGREERIIRLLLDEIARMPHAPFCAPMPIDDRLLRVCKAIIANPSDKRDIDDWAYFACMGRRTFTRAFQRETGMGLAVWRQQVRLMAALSMIASGLPVANVAFETGYGSPSAFSAMFRRAFGMAPSAYLLR